MTTRLWRERRKKKNDINYMNQTHDTRPNVMNDFYTNTWKHDAWLSDDNMTVSIIVQQKKKKKFNNYETMWENPNKRVCFLSCVWLIMLEFPFNGWLIGWRHLKWCFVSFFGRTFVVYNLPANKKIKRCNCQNAWRMWNNSTREGEKIK